jgi:MFS family permease
LKTRPEQDAFPEGLNNAYWFAGFNALSFQIVLSSPMVLYAKSLGASATVLGIITGMMPLLVIFQIPAAQYISRVGYKRFVYAGWGTRVMFIFLMALVPLTAGFLDAGPRLGLILMLLFGFNLSRGISSAGWLPWITSLVPPNVRGRYLARDAAWTSLASFVCFLLAARCLGRAPASWQFSVLFAFSAVMGATSLVFLKRIPEGVVPEEARAPRAPVPWLAMLRYRPFLKLVRAVVAWSLAYGGMQAFTVAFLKSEVRLAEGRILELNSVLYLGGLASLWLLGSRLDALGSKPVLTFSFVAWVGVSLGWGLVSGGVWPARRGLILALQFVMGLAAALVQMSNTRLAMAVVPEAGRNHFFAMFSVLANVTLGLAPILWGMLIDALGGTKVARLGLEWNGYSVFFLAVALVFVVTLLLARRLDEPQAASMEVLLKEILIQSPLRVWFRLWPRP